MEKTIILNKNEQISHNSNIILNNRKTLNLTGVDEVISSNENSIYLKVSGVKLQILGSNITITKLDTDNHILESTGMFDSLKFMQPNERFFKRIFKWQ